MELCVISPYGINMKFKIRFKLWTKEYEDLNDEDEKTSKPCLPSSKAPEIHANMNDTVINGKLSFCVLFIKDLLQCAQKAAGLFSKWQEEFLGAQELTSNCH